MEIKVSTPPSEPRETFGEGFRALYRRMHEPIGSYRPTLVNRFKELPWTLRWKCHDYKGNEWYDYIQEVWNGGVMYWGRFPAPSYRFPTKEAAQEWAAKALWDKEDPHNKNYEIVKI